MDPDTRPTALFVSYNGLLEPLGQSQVLAYAERLSEDHGHRIELLTFEKDEDGSSATREVGDRIAACGMRWHRRRYHSRPRGIATAADVLTGVRVALARIPGGVCFIHARSHVPACIADIVKAAKGVPFIFDHRGLLGEEYADAGIWTRRSVLYRIVVRLERRFLSRASSVVVLTDTYRQELALGPKCVTIPCAVDLGQYRHRPEVVPDYDLVYAGSWTGIYLAADMLRFFEILRKQNAAARFLVLVPQGQPLPDPRPGLQGRHVAPGQVPSLLVRARAGISFRRSGRAQRAASPVKISEYLACGLPVVTTSGVGDMDDIIRRAQTGVVLSDLSTETLERGCRELRDLLGAGHAAASRCRLLAEERFGLDAAARAYSAVYRRLEAQVGRRSYQEAV